MKILITGVTETHINHPERASSTKFVSVPELMRTAFTSHLRHDVEHREVIVGEDLSMYDKVFVYLYPVDHNTVTIDGAIWALTERPDAYLCLDDWSFQKLWPAWESKVALHILTNRTWLAPLFPWGDTKKMGLPVDDIRAWDPSPLYTLPECQWQPWRERKTEWYNASLSKEAHEWAAAQGLKWPIHSVGGKSLGQPRLLESDIVRQYGYYKGVLCPTYAHAGCGWWRVRYLHSAHARAILGGAPEELGAIHPAFTYTVKEIELLSDQAQEYLAWLQADKLKTATLPETLTKLQGWLE
jgi:hypothetical protein